MQPLEGLIQEAQRLAQGQLPASADTLAVQEVQRQLAICNACRYCEGFCAVFPAMTRRLEFPSADVHYLANLCHNCGACLHACQYAPPHSFELNLPRAMAQVRQRTYVTYAWPRPLGRLYERNGLTVALALAAGLVLFLLLSLARNGTLLSGSTGRGFSDLFPHHLLVSLFAPVFLWAVLALGLGVRRFWRDVTPATTGQPVQAQDAAQASADVLRLKYLDGGHGEGCHNADEGYTLSRRHAHHLTFYGFVLCFAATSVATLYHYVLSWHAPYPMPSLPKLLGVAGGISLTIGSASLLALKWRRHPLHGDPQQHPMDYGFIALLLLTATSGLALWLGGGTAAVGALLALHLGVVMALFLTLPYGKFAHGIFRSAALLRHAVERRQPSTLALGDD